MTGTKSNWSPNNASYCPGWPIDLDDEVGQIIANEIDNFSTEVHVQNHYDNIIKMVNVPSWADMDNDYTPTEARRIGSKGNYIILVSYSPKRTLGVGYSRVFMVEGRTGKPFPQMKGIWKEIHKRMEAKATSTNPSNSPWVAQVNIGETGNYLPNNVMSSETGEIRTAFGTPKPNELYGIAKEVNSIYRDWCRFRNETEYQTVEQLMEARRKVYALQMNAESFDKDIADARRTVKEYQDRIADLESRMNKLYEEGADALNLLEEHGIKIDLDGRDVSEVVEQDESNELDLGLLSTISGDLYISKDPYSAGLYIWNSSDYAKESQL